MEFKKPTKIENMQKIIEYSFMHDMNAHAEKMGKKFAFNNKGKMVLIDTDKK